MNNSTPSKIRWQGAVLLFLLSLIAYIDRSNIAVSTSSIIKAIHITPVQMGLISSAFSAAYAIVQIPGALYAKKVGARKAVTSVVLLWSIFTILTGFAGGFVSLLLIRILFGLSEAPLFPGMNQHMFNWFPLKERGFSNSLRTSGIYFASIITPPLAVLILQSLGLKWVFILSGLLGIIAAFLWYKMIRNDPSEHPRVNQEELTYIKSGLDARIEGAKIPWRSLFSSRSFWGIGFVFFCSLYVIQFFIYWLPFYLQQQLHMNLTTMGFAASVPWCFIFVTAIFAGRISDYLFKKNYSLFIARNVIIMIGFALAAVFLYISTLLTNPWAVVFSLSFGLGFAGFAGVLPFALSMDIGGEHTGMVMAWMNMWGFAAATIMPTVSALVGTHFGWNKTALTLVAVACLGVLFTVMVNPAKKVSDNVKKNANDSVTTVS